MPAGADDASDEEARAKIEGEDALRAIYFDRDECDYVIVRPGGLTEDEPKGVSAVELNQGDDKSGRISRADVAAFCVPRIITSGRHPSASHHWDGAASGCSIDGAPAGAARARRADGIAARSLAWCAKLPKVFCVRGLALGPFFMPFAPLLALLLLRRRSRCAAPVHRTHPRLFAPPYRLP